MQAQSINGITVTTYGTVDGTLWLYTDCNDYDHYKTLPQAITFDGNRYGLSGWNSDRNIACYQTNVKVATY